MRPRPACVSCSRLQWGRSWSGAESAEDRNLRVLLLSLQWGRSWSGAESGQRRQARDFQRHFNGAAPGRERRAGKSALPSRRCGCHFNGAAPGRERRAKLWGVPMPSGWDTSMGPLLVGSGETDSPAVVGFHVFTSMGPLLVGSGEVQTASGASADLLDTSMGPLLVGSGESSRRRRARHKRRRTSMGPLLVVESGPAVSATGADASSRTSGVAAVVALGPVSAGQAESRRGRRPLGRRAKGAPLGRCLSRERTGDRTPEALPEYC